MFALCSNFDDATPVSGADDESIAYGINALLQQAAREAEALELEDGEGDDDDGGGDSPRSRSLKRNDTAKSLKRLEEGKAPTANAEKRASGGGASTLALLPPPAETKVGGADTLAPQRMFTNTTENSRPAGAATSAVVVSSNASNANTAAAKSGTARLKSSASSVNEASDPSGQVSRRHSHSRSKSRNISEMVNSTVDRLRSKVMSSLREASKLSRTPDKESTNDSRFSNYLRRFLRAHTQHAPGSEAANKATAGLIVPVSAMIPHHQADRPSKGRKLNAALRPFSPMAHVDRKSTRLNSSHT